MAAFELQSHGRRDGERKRRESNERDWVQGCVCWNVPRSTISVSQSVPRDSETAGWLAGAGAGVDDKENGSGNTDIRPPEMDDYGVANQSTGRRAGLAVIIAGICV